MSVRRLDYNRRKTIILGVVSQGVVMDSVAVEREIVTMRGADIDVHAVQMALMRYFRLGLLKRVKSGGRYQYSLTERGLERLKWLESLKNPKN
jgi:DNA-binding transcriptional regulator PaaX